MDSSSPWIKAAPAENYQYNVAMQEMQGALSTQGNVQQVQQVAGAAGQNSGLRARPRRAVGMGMGIGIGVRDAESSQWPKTNQPTCNGPSEVTYPHTLAR